MSTTFNLILAVLIVVVVTSMAGAAAKRQGGQWVYYHFDGHGFAAGPGSTGSAFLAVRTGMAPLVLAEKAAQGEATALSRGTGAVAGICYLQSSGGKLAAGLPYLPVPHMSVQIFSGSRVVAMTESDDQGYFAVVLAAGRYTVSAGPARAEIIVEQESTILVPLRTGKRMVD